MSPEQSHELALLKLAHEGHVAARLADDAQAEREHRRAMARKQTDHETQMSAQQEAHAHQLAEPEDEDADGGDGTHEATVAMLENMAGHQAEVGKALAEAARGLNRPKKVVRGPDGEIAGVE